MTSNDFQNENVLTIVSISNESQEPREYKSGNKFCVWSTYNNLHENVLNMAIDMLNES